MARLAHRPSTPPLLLTGLALLTGCFGAPQLVGTDQVPDANLGWTELKDAKFETVTMPEVDELMEQLLIDQENPGCAVGIVEDGEVVYLRGYGEAVVDLDPNDGVDSSVPWTVGTTAPVGSISKPLTALAVMHLAEDPAQDFDLGDSVGEHIATTGNLGGVLLEELLTHSGGWGDLVYNAPLQHTYEVEHPMAHPRLGFQEYEATAPAAGPAAYSNLGYATLGAVLDAYTSDPAHGFGDDAGYERYVWHHVAMWSSYSLDARNMLSPAFALSWRQGDMPGLAHGYAGSPGQWTLYDPWHETGTAREGLAGPQGLWSMTVGDLARLVAVLQNREILSPGTYSDMLHPWETIMGRPYGYGVWVERNGNEVIEHGGDVGAFSAAFVTWPASNAGPFPVTPARGVALMCNGNSSGVGLGDVAAQIHGLLGTGTSSFDTDPSTEGAPVPAPALHGGTFDLQLRGASVSSPSNLFLPIGVADGMTLAVADAGDGTLTLTLGMSGDTVVLADSSYRDDELFHTPSFDATLDLRLGIVTLADATLHGSFTADAQNLAWATLEATLDARQIGGMDPSETWEDLCGFTAEQGTRCQPCDDGIEACFPVRIEGIRGERIVGGT